MTISLIKFVFFLIGLHELLYWIYFWQLKEYRLDRVRSTIRERAELWRILREQINLAKWYRPKVTLRAGVSLILGLLLFIIPTFSSSWLVYLYFVVLAPIWSAFCLGLVAPIFILWKAIGISRARQKMRSFQGMVIGITGSYGKSSTKEMLAQVLGKRYRVVKTAENTNSEIGIAQTVLNKVKGDEDYFIVEMGAYRVGEIRAICEIVHPKIGIITGIGDQHLDLFGSPENIRKAKYELIDSLPVGSLSLVADKDFRLAEVQNVHVFRDHVEFLYHDQSFSVPVLGKSLIRNILAVVKVAEHEGLSLEEISHYLTEINPESLWPKLKNLSRSSFLVDNSYNSSLESFLSALDYLSVWKDYHKIIVTPGLIELGANARKDHQIIGQALKKVDKVFVTAKTYFPELNASGNAALVENLGELIRQLRAEKQGKVIFLFQNRIPGVVIDRLGSDD